MRGQPLVNSETLSSPSPSASSTCFAHLQLCSEALAQISCCALNNRLASSSSNPKRRNLSLRAGTRSAGRVSFPTVSFSDASYASSSLFIFPITRGLHSGIWKAASNSSVVTCKLLHCTSFRATNCLRDQLAHFRQRQVSRIGFSAPWNLQAEKEAGISTPHVPVQQMSPRLSESFFPLLATLWPFRRHSPDEQHRPLLKHPGLQHAKLFEPSFQISQAMIVLGLPSPKP